MENTNLWKQPESFYEQECKIVFLFFKTKSVKNSLSQICK